jgi:hypothetical protein
MNKNILLYSLLISILFSGCSHFKFNWGMCDSIANDPNAVMPAECRNYNEEEAQKSFDNTRHDTSKKEDERILEYHKEDKEK